MEMFAAAQIWQRSEEYGVRLKTFISDTDCKTEQYLNSLQIYREAVQMKKEECVNHVGKRLWRALTDLVKQERTKGITLGGKGQGTLKEVRIRKLTDYYKKKLYYEIKAILQMSIGCFYQSAIAKGRKPGFHDKKIGTPIRKKFLYKILPIYNKLSDEKLLRRCAQCLTQNSNERLHSMIWRKCPKDILLKNILLKLQSQKLSPNITKDGLKQYYIHSRTTKCK
ncbi:uncharacterized protein LOC143371027 [Andrena cerasifolii]|uniref:uncharacterized protein LOC143371027 n=1 Tax=Andrena cerasifolii TaxID=2819439 RepID=UPI00403829B7